MLIGQSIGQLTGSVSFSLVSRDCVNSFKPNACVAVVTV